MAALEEAGFAEVVLPIVDYLEPYEPLLTRVEPRRALPLRRPRRRAARPARRLHAAPRPAAGAVARSRRRRGPRAAAAATPLLPRRRGALRGGAAGAPARVLPGRRGAARRRRRGGRARDAALLPRPARRGGAGVEAARRPRPRAALSTAPLPRRRRPATIRRRWPTRSPAASAARCAAAAACWRRWSSAASPTTRRTSAARRAAGWRASLALRDELAAEFPAVELTVDLAEFAHQVLDPALRAAAGERSYYDGLVFRAYAGDLALPAGSGGRYDRLFSRLGADVPAVGFSFGLERLLPEERGGRPPARRRGGRGAGGGRRRVVIRLALPKGRNVAAALAAFAAAGLDLAAVGDNGRKLWLELPRQELLGGETLEVLVLKDADLPLYVEYGVADLGVVGSDVLDESGADLLVPLRLVDGGCRMSLIGYPGALPGARRAGAPGDQVPAHRPPPARRAAVGGGGDPALRARSSWRRCSSSPSSPSTSCRPGARCADNGLAGARDGGRGGALPGAQPRLVPAPPRRRSTRSSAASRRRGWRDEPDEQALLTIVHLDSRRGRRAVDRLTARSGEVLDAKLVRQVAPPGRRRATQGRPGAARGGAPLRPAGRHARRRAAAARSASCASPCPIPPPRPSTCRRASPTRSSRRSPPSSASTAARSTPVSRWRRTASRSTERRRPFRRVAAYVPGGLASYPSTAVMTVVPARVAGVEEVAVVTPPVSWLGSPALRYTLGRLGVDEVWGMGGAHAVAALAYGTESVARVDKIVGPGNAWVTAAKREVAGDVAIDGLAGPTEVLIVADGGADPDLLAADLLAQAEHDPRAAALLVTPRAAPRQGGARGAGRAGRGARHRGHRARLARLLRHRLRGRRHGRGARARRRAWRRSTCSSSAPRPRRWPNG